MNLALCTIVLCTPIVHYSTIAFNPQPLFHCLLNSLSGENSNSNGGQNSGIFKTVNYFSFKDYGKEKNCKKSATFISFFQLIDS